MTKVPSPILYTVNRNPHQQPGSRQNSLVSLAASSDGIPYLQGPLSPPAAAGQDPTWCRYTATAPAAVDFPCGQMGDVAPAQPVYFSPNFEHGREVPHAQQITNCDINWAGDNTATFRAAGNIFPAATGQLGSAFRQLSPG